MIRSIVVSSLVLGLLPQMAFAQSLGRYQPSSSPISPYFNYFRGNTGGIPQYHAFVRPTVELRDFVKQQDSFVLRQRATNQYLQRQIQVGPTRATIGLSPMAYQAGVSQTGLPQTGAYPQGNLGGYPAGPPGAWGAGPAGRNLQLRYAVPGTGMPSVPASFMQYSHFFPALP